MPKLFAIGASQGGVDVLRRIASGLPGDFAGAVTIVLHIGAERSMLPSILSAAGPLPAAHAEHGEAIEPGRIYVAPPDRHLLVIDGRLELSHGPRENYVRPAVDPLLRSVAESYGSDAVGVILTGRLNDGTAGLFEIKRRGGVAIVQDPMAAEAPSMPQSALNNVAVDYCLPVSEIAGQLVRLSKTKSQTANRGAPVMKEELFRRPVAQTCPECGGAMAEETLGSLVRFRCHIGHLMTAEVLAANQLGALDHHIEEVVRFLNERAELCRDAADRHFARGNRPDGELWRAAAEEAARRVSAAKALADADWIHPEETAPAA